MDMHTATWLVFYYLAGGLEGWSYGLGCGFLLANNGAGSVDVSLHVLWVSGAWQELQRACCKELVKGCWNAWLPKGWEVSENRMMLSGAIGFQLCVTWSEASCRYEANHSVVA
ncbi:hypothetical protein E3N88_00859 [Mikania micrantha]|uniref:Uncharacterized protein n=1 Tax=Mikania micrantha TaxID=192012 RepID=A0A5N6Q022_9ASTR|nr:hypothetical protein E3N88_00859 [Mikania micrantha]